jgi:hypothetical protein
VIDDDDPLETPEQREARETKNEIEKFKRQRDIDDLKWLMGHKQGRRFAWRQLENYGVFRSSLSTDLITMAAREGLREGGLKLLADIHEHAPERYAEMMKEAKDGRSTPSNG